MWKRVNPEERKDVFEDVVFSLSKKEKEQERKQRERNCLYLAKIFKRMAGINFLTTWAEVSPSHALLNAGQLPNAHSKLLKMFGHTFSLSKYVTASISLVRQSEKLTRQNAL